MISPDGREMVTGNLYHCPDENHLGQFQSYSQQSRFTVSHSWIGQVFRLRSPHWSVNLEGELEFPYRQTITGLGMRSGFAFPVLINTEVVAVLEFFSSDNTEPNDELVQAMAYIGTQLGRVMERVRAKQTLQESQTLLAAAERLAQLGSWEWDVIHDKVTWSDELYRIYGLDPHTFDASYKAFLILVHPDDRDYVDSIIQHAHQNKQSFSYYHRIIRPNNEVRTLFAQGQPILNEAGELSKMIGTGQDVTNQKKVETRLAHQTQQLTALNQMGQMVTATFDLNLIFDRVLAELRPLLGADGIFILLQEGDELVFAAANGLGAETVQGQRVPIGAGVAAEVLQTGQARAVFDEEVSRRVLTPLVKSIGFAPQALLVAPLQLQGTLIGVMEAIHQQTDGFNEDVLPLLTAAAAWTAVAIGNAHLFEAQQYARQTAESLRNANLKLTQTLELNKIVETLLDNLDDLINSDQSCVLFPEGHQLRISSARGAWAHHQDDLIEVNGVPSLEEICEQKHSLLIPDTAAIKNWSMPLGNGVLSRSWLGVPLLAGEQVLGLYIAGKQQANTFNERHRLMAEALIGQASIAVQNARLYEEVLVSRQRMYRLNQKVISAQEDERRRVSRELHDEAGQALTALKISLNLIRYSLPDDAKAIRDQIMEAADLTNMTMEQIRLLAHALRPPVLDTFGLNASLEGLCTDFGYRTQLRIEYQGTDLPTLPDPVSISFYRFLQEALTNIAKHANAGHIKAILTYTALSHRVCLSVTDDGDGFAQTKGTSLIHTNAGLGLTGMQERFELLGGQVNIESVPGKGASVTACVPLSSFRET
ncbi:MAG: GAF domain-containing protein [Chloroflexi bacterium]|nr:GAF domain-containing protein [Chloroflexota bacterium]